MTTDPRLSIARIIEYYSARWKIEAGFREIQQDIGSAYNQTRNPDAVTNHLQFCLVATPLTWLYAANQSQAPARRYASEKTTEYAFADVRRRLVQDIADGGFGIDCPDERKLHRKSLIIRGDAAHCIAINAKLQFPFSHNDNLGHYDNAE